MTNSPKLPFKSYTVLPNSLILNNIFCTADTYRIFVLSLTADKVTGVTDTTIVQLANLVGESKFNYENKTSFTDKLRLSDDVDVKTEQIAGTATTSPIKRNQYKFRLPVDPEPFRMIHREFYDVDVEHSIKGYLIRLFSVTQVNTMFCGYSQRKLANLLHVSTTTIRNYNKILVEKGLIVELENGLLLTCPGFNPIIKKTPETKATLSAYKSNLEVAISSYNQSATIALSIDSLTVSDIHKLQLDKSTATFAHYFIDKFSKVNNLNSLAFYLSTGISRKSVNNENEQVIDIIMV